MRRDIGNEVIVAIAVVGVLAFALVFGIVLSVSNSSREGTVLEPSSTPLVRSNVGLPSAAPTLIPPTATFTMTLIPPTATFTATHEAAVAQSALTPVPSASTPTFTLSPTFTATPTVTPSVTFTVTHTVTPTATFTATDTLTPIPSTATFTATHTITPISLTATFTATQTVTRIPATATHTVTRIPSTATFTATQTVTPIPPTFTATHTFTPIPPTFTATPTVTPIPPTATFTATHTFTPIPPTATFTATLTASATPTSTRTWTPTATPTPFVLPTSLILPTGLPLPTAERNCSLPQGWVIYTVRDGDSFYAIATAAGISIEDLFKANCLNPTDNIPAGFGLYVPHLLTMPTSAPTPANQTLPAAQGCTAAGVRIIAPASGQTVTGIFNLVGVASLPDAGYYRVDIRPDSAETFLAYSRASSSVIGGVLTQINSGLFDHGLYWLRLTVFDSSGSSLQSCAIPVVFR